MSYTFGGMNSLSGGVRRLYSDGVSPNSLAKARVNPSWESKTKSSATSIILTRLSLSTRAAAVSRSERIYSKGGLPAASLNSRAACHGE